MATTDQNFSMFQGEDKRINIRVTDESGEDKNLAGSTVEWVMITDSDTRIEKSSTAGNILISGNTAQVVLLSSDTIGLNGYYQHEARVTDSENMSEVVAIGTITVQASKTR